MEGLSCCVEFLVQIDRTTLPLSALHVCIANGAPEHPSVCSGSPTSGGPSCLWCFRACIGSARVSRPPLQAKLLADIRTTVAMPNDDDKEAAVRVLKKEMNDWTAKYRNSGEGGRPSFSNMYSAVNALAGHWTSFGADAPVPKKRMARITKVRGAPASPTLQSLEVRLCVCHAVCGCM